MAKVKVSFDANNVTLRVRQTLQKVKRSKQLQSEIGADLTRRIKGEARRGRPYNNSRSFPKLKSSTVANRKRLAQFNPLGKPFRPQFSNLTLTGQLIDAISFEPSLDFVKIFVENSFREPYITSKDGKTAKGTPTNDQLAKFLFDKGFKLFQADALRRDPKITQSVRSKTLAFLRRALRVSQLRS